MRGGGIVFKIDISAPDVVGIVATAVAGISPAGVDRAARGAAQR